MGTGGCHVGQHNYKLYNLIVIEVFCFELVKLESNHIERLSQDLSLSLSFFFTVPEGICYRDLTESNCERVSAG